MHSLITTVFYDGDDALYFRAGETVFKVSPARLRHSTLFRSMLSLPPMSGSEAEGHSSRRPIQLEQITAEEFSHFMWAVHARAHEVVAFTRSVGCPEKCLKLLDIAGLAHRFEFDDDAECMLLEVVRLLKTTPGFAVGHVPHRLLQVASLWGPDAVVFRTALDITKAALLRNSPLQLVDLILVLERLGPPALLGLAYYRLALRGPGAWSDARLAREHVRRLSNGYFSICNLIWSIGDVRADCSHQPGSAWNALRNHIAAAPGGAPPDILGLLAKVPKKSPSFHCASCGRTYTGESEALQRARTACAEDRLLDLFTVDHMPVSG